MKPLITIQSIESDRVYWPGEEFVCVYRVDAVPATDITAVEASVLWYTEGKGEEDMAVHAFQRRLPADVPHGDLRQLDSIRTKLPNSPLSYNGRIVKIRWCVRVRVFLTRNREALAERTFLLGAVPAARLPDSVEAGAERSLVAADALSDLPSATANSSEE
jgi:hypothetical protein